MKPENLYKGMLGFANTITTLSLAVTAVVIFLQILFRYVLHAPLHWTEETARLSFIYVTFLGSAAALEHGEHISISFLTERLSSRMRRLLTFFNHSVLAVILFLLLTSSIKLTIESVGIPMPATRLSSAFYYAPVSIGSVLMFIITLAKLWALKRTDIEKI